MKFLCKLFGCQTKTVVKEVPIEVIKEVPVEVIKEVQADIYPKKPERPSVSGSLKEQLIKIYDHYGYRCPSDKYLDKLVEEIDADYIELTIDLIDTINDMTMKYLNRPAFDKEVYPALITVQSERATHNEVLKNKIKIRKERSRINYINDALRYEYPVCGCQVDKQ